MSNVNNYKEIAAFHPGYYISEIIEDMGISQAEFAARMGSTAKTVSQLINGMTGISNDLAKKLSAMLGTGADVWLNLQNTYDKKLIEIQQARAIDEQAELARDIDYSFFVEYAGLPEARNISSRVENLCRYLKVADLRIMLEPDFLIKYRIGDLSESGKVVINSRAWIQTAVNTSVSIETKPYNTSKLKNCLPELRNMTIRRPESFLPRMRSILAECGVAFVLLPQLRSAEINGAVKWVAEDRVMLAMNNHGLDAVSFWFTLFHEIKHVLQRRIKTVFVNGSAEGMAYDNEYLEDEADAFARNYLIPPKDFKRLNPTKHITDDEIVEFADKIGIHPGIVAERLQHEGIISKNRCSRFNEKYVIGM